MNIYKITSLEPVAGQFFLHKVDTAIITASSSEAAKLAYCMAHNTSPEEIKSVDFLCPA